MILDANGILKIKSTVGGGLGENGYPIKPTTTWGDPIKCNIKANSKANIGITNNNNVFETSSYEVLIEQQTIDAKIVSLERDGVALGEFQILGEPERLNIVGNIKILVKWLVE